MQNRIIGVIAPKGSGKTFKVNEIMRDLDRVAAFDMLHEAGYLCADDVIVGEPKRFAEALRAEKFKLTYRPTVFLRGEEDEEFCPEFEPFVRLCYLQGKMYMIIDEAHQLCTPHSIPDALRDACRLGRHRELSIIFITQSWSAVSRVLTAGADEFYFFKIIEPRDLQGIRERCGPEISEAVRDLRRLDYTAEGQAIPGECIHWTTWDGIEGENAE